MGMATYRYSTTSTTTNWIDTNSSYCTFTDIISAEPPPKPRLQSKIVKALFEGGLIGNGKLSSDKKVLLLAKDGSDVYKDAPNINVYAGDPEKIDPGANKKYYDIVVLADVLESLDFKSKAGLIKEALYLLRRDMQNTILYALAKDIDEDGLKDILQYAGVSDIWKPQSIALEEGVILAASPTEKEEWVGKQQKSKNGQ